MRVETLQATDDAVVTEDGYVVTTYEEIEAAREAHANGETMDYREAIEALRAAPPKPEPLKLTRQAARRLAMRLSWAYIRDSSPQLNRAERRRMWHQIKFSDLARTLVAGPEAQT